MEFINKIKVSDHDGKAVHVIVPDDYHPPVLYGGLEWVEALQSGKYQQGQNRLITNSGGYCCLGVWCAIRGYEQGKDSCGYPYFVIGGRSLSTLPSDGSLLSEGFLPKSVYVKIEDEPAIYKWDVLNDNYKLPFTLLAKIARAVYDLQ